MKVMETTNLPVGMIQMAKYFLLLIFVMLGKYREIIGKRYLMDKIRFKCHKCGKKLKSHKDHTGKQGKCPRCGTKNIIPEQKDIVTQVAELLQADDTYLFEDWMPK
jgi:DNA-directed RNA polymerase subunit RPC12/RpoP